jgi:hypothetical protein
MKLRRHLKRWLVPHKQNDHRPHLVRAHGLALMAALIVAVQIVSFVAEPSYVHSEAKGKVLAYATDITPDGLFIQTNQERADYGLPPLRMDAQLNDSAGMKAANMFALDYWAHVSPTGIQPWYWFTKAGYNYSYAGENLAMNFDTTSGVMQGWMNSPGHKANILNPHYVDVGFAVENGTLVGQQTTLVVAHYGAPATPQLAAVPLATPSPTPVPVSTQPTPLPAPPPLPAIVPTPAPTPSPTTARVAGDEVIPAAPGQVSYSLFKPLSLVSTASPGTVATIILLLILLLVYVVMHMTVWRKGLKRWRSGHYRLYAAAQISGITLVIIVLATSGYGRVG